jgi:hypothetical protein
LQKLHDEYLVEIHNLNLYALETRNIQSQLGHRLNRSHPDYHPHAIQHAIEQTHSAYMNFLRRRDPVVPNVFNNIPVAQPVRSISLDYHPENPVLYSFSKY